MNPTEEDTSTSTSTAAVDGAAAADAAFALAAGTVIQVQPDPRPAAAPVPTPPELTYLPKDRINELKELNALEHVASIARAQPPPNRGLRPAMLPEWRQVRCPHKTCPAEGCDWEADPTTTMFDWYQHWEQYHSSERPQDFNPLSLETVWFPVQRSYYPALVQLPEKTVRQLAEVSALTEMNHKLHLYPMEYYFSNRRPLLDGETHDNGGGNFDAWDNPIHLSKFAIRKNNSTATLSNIQQATQESKLRQNIPMEKRLYNNPDHEHILTATTSGGAPLVELPVVAAPAPPPPQTPRETELDRLTRGIAGHWDYPEGQLRSETVRQDVSDLPRRSFSGQEFQWDNHPRRPHRLPPIASNSILKDEYDDAVKLEGDALTLSGESAFRRAQRIDDDTPDEQLILEARENGTASRLGITPETLRMLTGRLQLPPPPAAAATTPRPASSRPDSQRSGPTEEQKAELKQYRAEVADYHTKAQDLLASIDKVRKAVKDDTKYRKAAALNDEAREIVENRFSMPKRKIESTRSASTARTIRNNGNFQEKLDRLTAILEQLKEIAHVQDVKTVTVRPPAPPAATPAAATTTTTTAPPAAAGALPPRSLRESQEAAATATPTKKPPSRFTASSLLSPKPNPKATTTTTVLEDDDDDVATVSLTPKPERKHSAPDNPFKPLKPIRPPAAPAPPATATATDTGAPPRIGIQKRGRELLPSAEDQAAIKQKQPTVKPKKPPQKEKKKTIRLDDDDATATPAAAAAIAPPTRPSTTKLAAEAAKAATAPPPAAAAAPATDIDVQDTINTGKRLANILLLRKDVKDNATRTNSVKNIVTVLEMMEEMIRIDGPSKEVKDLVDDRIQKLHELQQSWKTPTPSALVTTSKLTDHDRPSDVRKEVGAMMKDSEREGF